MLAQRKNPYSVVMGAFQAKTYFSELLRKVEEGAFVTITRNGHDVAVMQSPKTMQNTKALESWSRLMSVAAQISEQNKDHPVTVSDIKEWKLEGRK